MTSKPQHHVIGDLYFYGAKEVGAFVYRYIRVAVGKISRIEGRITSIGDYFVGVEWFSSPEAE